MLGWPTDEGEITVFGLCFVSVGTGFSGRVGWAREAVSRSCSGTNTSEAEEGSGGGAGRGPAPTVCTAPVEEDADGVDGGSGHCGDVGELRRWPPPLEGPEAPRGMPPGPTLTPLPAAASRMAWESSTSWQVVRGGEGARSKGKKQ